MSTPTSSQQQQQQTTQTQSPQSFRPLEYWKPPKAVRHHIRAKSSALFSPGNRGERVSHSFVKLEEGRDVQVENKEMSFNTLNGMVSRMKGGATETINMSDSTARGDDGQYHSWWNVKHWGKKGWLILVGVVAVIIVIIAVAVTQVAKANRYPDYSKLTYSLAENCTYLVS